MLWPKNHRGFESPSYRQFMPKKKLQKSLPKTSCYRNEYITYMEYFATGEGFTYEINFCYADTKKEAIEKHLDRFGVTDEAGRQYFGVGIEVNKLGSKRAKEILASLFTMPDSIIEHLKNAGLDLYFRFHYNYS